MTTQVRHGAAESAVRLARSALSLIAARTEEAIRLARRRGRPSAEPTVIDPNEATLEKLAFASGPLKLDLTEEQAERVRGMDARVAAKQKPRAPLGREGDGTKRRLYPRPE
jgi:hypothetical protein